MANEKLIAAFGTMEVADEEPRSVQELSATVEISPRQMERLFEQYVNTSPNRFYLKLWLNRPRVMLQQSSKPILQIAIACEFVSASHFSRCYRVVHGHRPSGQRAGTVR